MNHWRGKTAFVLDMGAAAIMAYQVVRAFPVIPTAGWVWGVLSMLFLSNAIQGWPRR